MKLEDESAEIIKICEIHKQRLNQATRATAHIFPLTTETIENFKEQDLFAMETLVNRFAKLQDLMGTKLFDLCLLKLGETIDGLSMIDKANKLEKASVLTSSNDWMKLRKLRNSVTHEYPGHPEITANILNKLRDHIDEMLSLYDKMKNIIMT